MFYLALLESVIEQVGHDFFLEHEHNRNNKFLLEHVAKPFFFFSYYKTFKILKITLKDQKPFSLSR